MMDCRKRKAPGMCIWDPAPRPMTPAEQMREAAAQEIENKKYGAGHFAPVAEVAASIRALPLPPDLRDAEIATLRAEVERLKALVSSPWDDKPLPEDHAIHAAHPMHSDDFQAAQRYLRAVNLVSARHGKYALVNLVNWLLSTDKDPTI